MFIQLEEVSEFEYFQRHQWLLQLVKVDQFWRWILKDTH